jgi:hypothetical protein
MEMKREGLSTWAISILTGYDRKTMRQYLRTPETAAWLWAAMAGADQAGTPQGLSGRPAEGRSVWNAQVLLREIQQHGYSDGPVCPDLRVTPRRIPRLGHEECRIATRTVSRRSPGLRAGIGYRPCFGRR